MNCSTETMPIKVSYAFSPTLLIRTLWLTCVLAVEPRTAELFSQSFSVMLGRKLQLSGKMFAWHIECPEINSGHLKKGIMGIAEDLS